jgi:aminoglycoside/choline kinase family phosphotransferase
MILEKECRYFVEAFLNTYCNLDLSFDRFKDEFVSLSEKALKFAVTGFMHRDFQSRNIMFKENRPYVIDFQGGRRGPVQYDLASLLIDPYVELSESVRKDLAGYGAEKMSGLKAIDTDRFMTGYRYCCITRNLQILGAFGFLSRVKNKPSFENYIPAASRTLKESVNPDEFPKLASVAGKICGLYGERNFK